MDGRRRAAGEDRGRGERDEADDPFHGFPLLATAHGES
jgi:hypothetical protein